MQSEAPGRISLAGAYAFGYGALGMAQLEGEDPDWFNALDPLDTLFLGTVWPQNFRDEFEFANARDAWLQMLRDTVHWDDIQQFVAIVVEASEELGLAIDEGELMLLVAGRLGAARLDRRRIPRDLLPEVALAESRVARGVSPDYQLPVPVADAAGRVERFWAGTELDLPQDGTAVDALRAGLRLLGRAGMPVREESSTLLPALYVALVAKDDEELAQAGERATAWAMGLPGDSPLIPVADALLVGHGMAMSADTLLGHLFAVPAFTEPVRSLDRRWHSSPGIAFVDLAFEMGISQVRTRAGKVTKLDPEAIAALRAQHRRFEAAFGRPPAPDEPIFFDPKSRLPRMPSLETFHRDSVALWRELGLDPAWIHAYEQTRGLLPRPDGTFFTESDEDEWNLAINEYLERDGGQEPDNDGNLQIIRTVAVMADLKTAAKDPEHGVSLVRMLDSDQHELLQSFLLHMSEFLSGQLREDAVVATAAHEYARAWAGGQLAAEVRRESGAPADSAPISEVKILLTAAVAVFAQANG
ncbi:hypothetical protein [Nonomuraea endophytica]|uniref:hypothetical protein n=1 Tax=Nonomuraea endophytica TaxID=714136 RepID=UPI0037CCBDD7